MQPGKRISRYWVPLAMGWVLAALAGSCQANPAPGLNQAPTAPAPAQAVVTPAVSSPGGPFPLPRPSAVQARLHSAKSASSILTRTASDYVHGLSQHAASSGTDLILSPSWADSHSPFSSVSYAVYRFDLRARSGQLALHTLWSREPKDFGMLWLGLSNWQLDCWDWHSGLPTGSPQLATDALARYCQPQTYELYVAVVLLGEGAGLLSQVWLTCSLQGDWWMYGREPGRGAWSPFLGPDYPLLLWRRQVGYDDNFEHPACTPVYDSNGTLYTGANGPNVEQRQLLAIQPDGTEKWTFVGTISYSGLYPPAASPFYVPAVAADGSIYWCADYCPLYAINQDGVMKWSFSGRYAICSHPVIGINDIVYVIGVDSETDPQYYLYAVNSDGTQCLELQLGAGPVGTPAIAGDGTLYIVSGTRLLCFSRAGKLKWEFETGGVLQASDPTLSLDGRIFVSSDSNPGLFYVLNPDGKVAWSYTLPGASPYGAATGPGGSVYVGDASGMLYAFNSAGELRWTYRISLWSAVLKPAVDAAGVVYAASSDTRLYAINPDGSLKWWYTAPLPLVNGPVIGEDGVLYVVDANAQLYAIGTSAPQDRHTISGYVRNESGAGLGGVLVSITGVPSVVTAGNGFYSIPNVTAGAYLVSPTKDDYKFEPIFYLAEVDGEDVQLPDFIGSVASKPEWPMWGRDPGHTRRSPHLGPDTPELKWQGWVGESVTSGIMVGSDGAVYAQGEHGRLVAFNPDGTLHWDFSMCHDTESSPCIGPDSAIYTNNGGSLLYAISPGGVIKWTIETSSRTGGSPVPTPDGLVLQCSDDKLLALDMDGTLSWYAPAYGIADTIQAPAIDSGGVIYFYDGSGNLTALWPDGSQKWSSPIGSKYRRGNTSPVVGDDGTIYFGLGQTMYAFNPDGTEKWSFVTYESDLHSSPAIAADGSIYFGSTGKPFAYCGWLIALNADGTLKWEHRFEGSLDASPAVDAAGTVYAGYWQDTLKAINPDGTLKWAYDTGCAVTSSPAIGADGTVYVGGADGRVYAIGPGTP